MSNIINVTEGPEFEKIKADVQLAHDFLNKHFRMDLINEKGLLDKDLNPIPIHARVEFTAPDRATVTPLFLGAEGGISFDYRLQWEQDDGLAWTCRNLLTGQPMGYLMVRHSPNAERKTAIAREGAQRAAKMPPISIDQAYRLGSMFRKGG
jgi:hypothetical protein